MGGTAASGAEAPTTPSAQHEGPEPVDWLRIARVLRQGAAATAPLFTLPKRGVAALVVVFCWWPILLSILFVVAASIAAYLVGLAIVTVGMSRPLPERRRAVNVLIATSCSTAAIAVLLATFTPVGVDAPIIVSLATLSVGSAIVACISLLRRHLQHSDRWQPRRTDGSGSA